MIYPWRSLFQRIKKVRFFHPRRNSFNGITNQVMHLFSNSNRCANKVFFHQDFPTHLLLFVLNVHMEKLPEGQKQQSLSKSLLIQDTSTHLAVPPMCWIMTCKGVNSSSNGKQELDLESTLVCHQTMQDQCPLS